MAATVTATWPHPAVTATAAAPVGLEITGIAASAAALIEAGEWAAAANATAIEVGCQPKGAGTLRRQTD